MTQDRVHEESFLLGHNFISYMLAVPKETVTSAMEVLSKAKLLTYIGERIRIFDRQRLEEASCPCHGAIKREYKRLLSDGL